LLALDEVRNRAQEFSILSFCGGGKVEVEDEGRTRVAVKADNLEQLAPSSHPGRVVTSALLDVESNMFSNYMQCGVVGMREVALSMPFLMLQACPKMRTPHASPRRLAG
jgi:hypothetical protein